jgi:hypothetical protein
MVERRGKPSKGDLEVVPLMPGDAKPSPPEDMSDAEKVVWQSIVDAMPLRYFGRETWPNLRSLCRHTVASDLIWARYIEAIESGKKADIVETLSRLHNRESAAVRRLSADLRLSKSVRSQPVVHERAKANQVIKRPWDD